MSDPSEETRGPDWLSPSAALTRFEVGDTDLALGGAMDVEQVRYAARLGDYGILLPEDTVSEVLDRAEIYPIPNTAPWFEGLINLRGTVVPVFDLRKLFNSAPIPGERQMLLVIDKGETALGIAIDGVPVPAPECTPMDQRPPLPEVLKKFTTSAFERGDQIWLQVDLKGLVSSLAVEIAA